MPELRQLVVISRVTSFLCSWLAFGESVGDTEYVQVEKGPKYVQVEKGPSQTKGWAPIQNQTEVIIGDPAASNCDYVCSDVEWSKWVS